MQRQEDKEGIFCYIEALQTHGTPFHNLEKIKYSHYFAQFV